MADSKSAYSEAASYYVETTTAQDEAMARAYARARARKDRHRASMGNGQRQPERDLRSVRPGRQRRNQGSEVHFHRRALQRRGGHGRRLRSNLRPSSTKVYTSRRLTLWQRRPHPLPHLETRGNVDVCISPLSFTQKNSNTTAISHITLHSPEGMTRYLLPLNPAFRRPRHIVARPLQRLRRPHHGPLRHGAQSRRFRTTSTRSTASSCAAWLRERMKRPVPPILQDFYEKLLEYAERAIELGTGVVVEL